MKKRITRILSAVVCLAMMLTINIFATSNESRDSATMQKLYGILREQNALEMLDIFEYVYNAKNPTIIPFRAEDDYTRVYAPHGGTLEAELDVYGIQVDTASTYLNYDDTYYYVLDSQSLNAGDIILAILGYIPIVGPLASTIANQQMVVTSYSAELIKDAGGYAELTVTETIDGTIPAVLGWTQYPYMVQSNQNLVDINWEVFPEHDSPFN